MKINWSTFGDYVQAVGICIFIMAPFSMLMTLCILDGSDHSCYDGHVEHPDTTRYELFRKVPVTPPIIVHAR